MCPLRIIVKVSAEHTSTEEPALFPDRVASSLAHVPPVTLQPVSWGTPEQGPDPGLGREVWDSCYPHVSQ